MSTPADLLPDRILEQVEPWTAWDRRAWEPGTVLRLREVGEASLWVSRGVLSEGALTYLRTSLNPVLGQDNALLDGAIRQQLSELLRGDLTRDSQRERRLRVLTEFVGDGYLTRWVEFLRSGKAIHLERSARYISSHVLDCGFDPEWVRKEMGQKIKMGIGAAELVEFLDELVSKPHETFTGWVIVKGAPDAALLEARPGWLTPTQLSHQMQRAGRTMAGIRALGALEFAVTARDPRAATAEVARRIQRLQSRAAFTRNEQELVCHHEFFCSDGKKYALSPDRRAVTVLSLVKNKTLYVPGSDDERARALDDALQLAAQLRSPSPSVAAAGAWAALECLLVVGAQAESEKRGRAAASRAATLVAASWPRAELTRLSYRVSDETNAPALLAHALDDAGRDSAKRTAALLQWLEAGKPLTLTSSRDDAALARMRELVANPKAVLKRIEQYTEGSFLRLYRQRNMVLHGGHVRSVALESCIRTTGPLVSAVLDRLSYALERHDVEPLDAVARADSALKAVGSKGCWPLNDLALA